MGKMSYKKLVTLGVGLLMLALVVVPSMAPFIPKASALSTGEWVNSKTITAGGKTFVYSKTSHGTLSGAGHSSSPSVAVFVEKPASVSCTITASREVSFDIANTANTKQTLTYKLGDVGAGGAAIILISLQPNYPEYKGDGTDPIGTDSRFNSYIGFTAPQAGAGDQGCGVSPDTSLINIGNMAAAKLRFIWVDANTITDVSSGWTYKNSDSNHPDRYYRTPPNMGTCASYIQSNGDYYATNTSQKDKDYHQDPGGGNCWYKLTSKNTIGNPENATNPGDPNAVVADPDCNDNTGTDAQGNCKVPVDPPTCAAEPFNWILCPAITLFLSGSQLLDSFIMNTLDIDVKPIFDTPNQKGTASYGYYTAWNAFRVIATALIVVAGLVMVTSQALGFEFLDAYTIRKTLPRLIVAVIGISLSWPLMRFGVELFDNMGIDLRGLIYGPFRTLNPHIGIGTSILTGFAAGVGIAALGFASFTIFLSILITVLIGFLALVLRQIALILLIVLAPIAIACYILPNTQKAWRFWFDNFLGLLMAFPIISGLVAVGHVFAIVALSSDSSTASITTQASGLVTHFTMHGFTQLLADTSNNVGHVPAQVMGAGAWVAPYGTFLRAMTWGSGIVTNAISGLGGALGLDKVSKGLSNYRTKIAGGRFRKMQNQTLWDNSNPIGKRMNKVASWATDPLNNLAVAAPNVPGLRKRSAKVLSHIEHAKTQQTQALAKNLNEFAMNNDKAFRATNGALHDGFTAETKAKLAEKKLLGKNLTTLDDYDKMTDILNSSSDQTERLAGGALHGFRGTAATLYQDDEASRASLAGASMLGVAQHGFLNPHDLDKAAQMTLGGSDVRANYEQDPATGEYKLVGVTGGDTSQRSFAQGIATQSQVIASRSRPDIGAGYALDWQDGAFRNALAETHTDAATGKPVVKNESIRALDVVTRMNSDSLGGAKAGIYKTGDLGIGDAITYLVNAPKADSDVGRAAIEETERWKTLSADDRAEINARSKRQGTAEYQTLKVATAARKREEFVKTVSQIISPYSRADTENRTELIALLNKAGPAGQEIIANAKRQEMSQGAIDRLRDQGQEPPPGSTPQDWMGGV